MIRLDAGSHNSPDQGGCVMEVVSMLAKQPWTDSPTCTNEVITRAAQAVNDRLGDNERQRLVPLIPRILRARRTDSDRRVNVRLALWAARSVLGFVRDKDRPECERALRSVELWLAGDVTDEEMRADAYAYAYDAAAYDAAAYAAAYAYAAAAYAAAAAAAAAAYDPVAWLDELLDVWEKAVNEEGEALWVPTEWEDEALAYLAERNA